MLMLVANVARPGVAVVGEELAVMRAVAGIVNREATRPFENLYFVSEFAGASFVATSLENPDRNQFCGLTRPEALTIVYELKAASDRPVQLDKETAKSAGLKIGRWKDPRFPYVVLSRVLFGPGNQYAWVAVELNGKAGAVVRLDKVDGEWKKTSRCGGWVKYEN